MGSSTRSPLSLMKRRSKWKKLLLSYMIAFWRVSALTQCLPCTPEAGMKENSTRNFQRLPVKADLQHKTGGIKLYLSHKKPLIKELPINPKEQQPLLFPCTFQQGLVQPSQAFQQTGWVQQPSQTCQHGFQQPGHSLFGGPFQSGGHGCAPVHSAQQMHHGAASEPMMAFGQHVPGHFGAHQVHHGSLPPWRKEPGTTSKASSVVSPKPKPTSRVPSVDENEQAAQENQWYYSQDQSKPDTTSETDPPTSPIEEKQQKQPSRVRTARPKKKLPQPKKVEDGEDRTT